MEHDFEITQAKIAARKDLSRARVTQLMNLLEFPEEIQRDLQTPPAPLEIYSFSERCLRQIVACGNRELQLRKWRELVCECHLGFSPFSILLRPTNLGPLGPSRRKTGRLRALANPASHI